MAVGVSLSRAQNPHMGSEQREAVPQTLHFGPSMKLGKWFPDRGCWWMEFITAEA